MTDLNVPGNTNSTPVSTGTHYTFTYTRPADALDVNYVVEWSEGRASWETSGVTSAATTVGNVMTVVAQVPAPASGQCFMRVRVVRP